MADVFTIAGSAINMVAHNATLDRCVPLVKGGLPELHFSRLLQKLTTLPDAWSGQPVTLTVSGTLIFSGDIGGYVDRWMQPVGWVREYRCLGLRNRADYVPITDEISLTDTSVFNLPSDDVNWVAARSGLTVAAIVSAILIMPANAAALNAAGVGAYTSMGPPAVLPSLTTSDLAGLTVIPPFRVSISGERILQSLEAFVQSCHPNHWLHVQPDGTIRFLDQRLATNNTLVLGTDPRIGMPTMTRDYFDCYSQVEVRGNTLATPVILQTLPWPGSTATDGGLVEDFGWGGHTSAAAKALWRPSDYQQPGTLAAADDTGTLTCTDSTHVTVTSSNSLETWASNYWAGAQGTIWLYGDSVPGIGQYFATKIVSNTALTAGGTSILTLGTPLTSLAYGSYKIWGLDAGPSVVYRKYAITWAAANGALLNVFPYPVAVTIAPASNAAWLTSSIQGYVQVSYTSGGGPPYNLETVNITVDPVNMLVYFDAPTAFVINAAAGTYTAPFNVMVLLAVAIGTNSVTLPSPSTYSGTLYTVEGVQRKKTVTVLGWTDASNLANMTTFCQEFLDSVNNVVVEGQVPYAGLLTTFLTCGATGQAISITGNDSVNSYVTGWETLALPVVAVELIFNNGPDGTSYSTNLQLSNRRGRFTADAFLRPNILGSQLGVSSDIFSGAATPGAIASQEQYSANYQAQMQANTAKVMNQAGNAAIGGAPAPFGP
jgi:hypothetical protein